MISVNQGIWTSLTEKVKKERAHNISHQGGTFEWEKIFKVV